MRQISTPTHFQHTAIPPPQKKTENPSETKTISSFYFPSTTPTTSTVSAKKAIARKIMTTFLIFFRRGEVRGGRRRRDWKSFLGVYAYTQAYYEKEVGELALEFFVVLGKNWKYRKTERSGLFWGGGGLDLGARKKEGKKFDQTPFPFLAYPLFPFSFLFPPHDSPHSSHPPSSPLLSFLIPFLEFFAGKHVFFNSHSQFPCCM